MTDAAGSPQGCVFRPFTLPVSRPTERPRVIELLSLSIRVSLIHSGCKTDSIRLRCKRGKRHKKGGFRGILAVLIGGRIMLVIVELRGRGW